MLPWPSAEPPPLVLSQCGEVPAGHVKLGVTFVLCWEVEGDVDSPPLTVARSDRDRVAKAEASTGSWLLMMSDV